MRALFVSLVLTFGCGGGSRLDHCAPDEVGTQRCGAGGRVEICEPSIAPCYPEETVEGSCPPGVRHAELEVERNVWQVNGGPCTAN